MEHWLADCKGLRWHGPSPLSSPEGKQVYWDRWSWAQSVLGIPFAKIVPNLEAGAVQTTRHPVFNGSQSVRVQKTYIGVLDPFVVTDA